MFNFYRRFTPTAAQVQALLNNLLQGNVKGKTPVEWTQEAEAAFENSKVSIEQATLLAHPRINAPLAIFFDASDFSVGAALQKRIDDDWDLLAFFPIKLSTAERKYATYDRELLAIYEAVNYFCHMLEARVFTI